MHYGIGVKPAAIWIGKILYNKRNQYRGEGLSNLLMKKFKGI